MILNYLCTHIIEETILWQKLKFKIQRLAGRDAKGY